MTRPGDTSQTLGRGLDVLELVAASTEGLTPAQISTELRLSRTIVYRLVGTLVEHRLLRRNAEGLLTAGLGTVSLSQNVAPTLRHGSRPLLEKLAEQLGATTYLAIADGEEALAVSVVEPRTTTLHLTYRPGSRTLLGTGALGQALEAAREGQVTVFESAEELIAGAKGVVASVPAWVGLPCAVGAVTLAATDTSTWAPQIEATARELGRILLG